MNKAITDGIVFQPLPFSAGLGVWSSGDGTPGSDTYATGGSGVFVSADQDFGGCLEINKSAATTKLRYMGETGILPGCYLRVTARVKAVSGDLPSVRIAAWAGQNGGGEATGAATTGPVTALTSYGEVVEISAIIGTGDRTGVDLVWNDVAYGHFGIDLTGPNGGVVRVDDLQIEDVTSAFHMKLLSRVDVRDYGAIGDGITDDADAFIAADAAAFGREVLVPEGIFALGKSVTMQSSVVFEGTVTQGAADRFILQKNFDYPAYVDAFGSEELAFKKAYQALLNFSDHESLDLGGRRISLSEPIDMQACDATRTVFATRRVVRNGQFQPITGPAWDTDVTTSQATYSISSPRELSNVINVANVAVGSLVTAAGVGREVYVTSTNVAQKTIELSQPLYDAAGTQTFTFKRFKYLLDFSGYDDLAQFILDDVEFQCAGEASAIIMAPQGLTFQVRDCFFTKPKDRGISSIGRGCQGMMIDRCNFVSNEQPLSVQNRTSIGFNSNANDVKVRDNRVALFKHFCVIAGTGTMVLGNHWFHGDSEPDGVRKGGIIFTAKNCRNVVTGNYCDNNFIEWTNEHDEDPAHMTGFSFGGLTITGNTFLSSDTAPWFNFIVVKPYGPGHFIHGLSVLSNVFRSINGNIDRVDGIDTAFADLDFSRMRAVTFAANTFHNVTEQVQNPASLTHTEASASTTWVAETAPYLPFGGRARFVDGVMPNGAVQNSANSDVFSLPWADVSYGPNNSQVRFVWETAVKGTVRYTARMDNPL